jgi:hypothetical protein
MVFFFQMFKPLGDLYYFTIPQGGVVIYPFILYHKYYNWNILGEEEVLNNRVFFIQLIKS